MSEVQDEYNRLITSPEQAVPGLSGTWHVAAAEVDVNPVELAAWADSLQDQVPVRCHKQRSDRSAAHHVFDGRPVFVKTWEYRGAVARLKQLRRPGKGKSGWAAGRALLSAGFATPAPLAYLELRTRHGVPLRSIYVGDYWEGAVNARHWLRSYFSGFTPEQAADTGQLLLDLWSSLRKQGVYHADFKLYNLLVRPGDAVWSEGFNIIDVDAVQIGRTIGRREILRNLVQLNGSLGGWVPRKVRMDWLTRFADLEPWCLAPGIVDEIEKTTAARLKRQLRRIDGP